MRTIEQAMLEAIASRQNWQANNTSVFYNDTTNTSIIRLHGNLVAYYCHDTAVYTVNQATLANYPTATTKSRLRALGVNVTTKKGITYLLGEAV